MARQPDWAKLMSPEEAAEARRTGTEVIGLGALLVFAGLLAIISPVWTAAATVTVIGLALVLGAIAHVVRGARQQRTPTNLFIGILAGIIGFILLARPVAAAETLTLLIASLLLTAGIVRVVVSLVLRDLQWRWTLANGVVSAVLGLILFAQWPAAALVTLGVLVGLELLVSGGLMIATVIGARRLVSRTEAQRRREMEDRPPPVH